MSQIAKYLIVTGLAGVFLYSGLLTPVVTTVWAVSMKARGRAPECDWGSVLTFYHDMSQFSGLIAEHRKKMKIERRDPEAGLVQISHPVRSYWVPDHPGIENLGLAYTIAEHDRTAKRTPEHAVKDGDIVIDCGAYVGVFTAKALSLGASKVIAVEPQPTNVECLRRNFPAEIETGRLIVVPEAVWSREGGTMTLSTVDDNPASGGLITGSNSPGVEVPLTTIDRIVADLRLNRVDFIKFDIEGAEPQALQGARGTLRKHRPRLLIDRSTRPYHLITEPEIGAAGYDASLGWCEPVGNTLAPHNVFFHQ